MFIKLLHPLRILFGERSRQNFINERFVINVSVGIFNAHHNFFDLIRFESFTQRLKYVPQFGAHDFAIFFLVENFQAFNKIGLCSDFFFFC